MHSAEGGAAAIMGHRGVFLYRRGRVYVSAYTLPEVKVVALTWQHTQH